jgi:hypothetical protein
LTNTNVTNFRTAIGLGATNDVQFGRVFVNGVLDVYSTASGAVEVFKPILIADRDSTNAVFQFEVGSDAAIARTNLGLGWSALTNTNAGTGFVSVNTNGVVVSPTNFWQAAPISTTVQYQTNVTGTSTNAATNSRNLFLFSLAPSVVGVTNTVTLPTNPATTFEGDRATIIHLATNSTNTVTAIGQLGAATNLITLNQADEAILLMYRGGAWVLSDNISYVEPIFFSGTNASANAAASRTNLRLGATNDVVFQSVQAGTNDPFVTFDNLGITIESTNTNTGAAGIAFIGAGASRMAANTRTNLGLGGTNTPAFSGVTIGDYTVNSNSSGDLLFNYNVGGGGTPFTVRANGIVLGVTMGGQGSLYFATNNTSGAATTRTNLALGETNIVTFAGLTNNGDITINQTTATNGLLFIRRTNNEAFLGMANLIASNNTTINNETLFRVGVAEATNRSAQFGFRSTNTNGNGVAVFSVFGYNALMMIGPSDPAAGTNPIEATVYSVNPTNKVMTLIKTNTGATMFHRPIEFENTTNQAVTRTNLGLGETNNVTFSALTLSSDLTLGSGDNIVLSTTTGTKIGTATNQLLGFYNQTPITRPSSTGVTTNGFTANGPANGLHADSRFTGGIGTNAYTVSDIVAHLKSLGLIAP